TATSEMYSLSLHDALPICEVAIWYALVVGVGMSAGIYVSGRLIDRFGARTRAAYAIIPAISLLLALPFFLGFVWAPHWQLALVRSEEHTSELQSRENLVCR